jgi:hypothetical protein
VAESAVAGMWQYVLLPVLDINLYAGIPYSQGTGSGPRDHLGRGNKPPGEAIILYLLLIEKPSGQYRGLICDESLTCHELNSNPKYFGDFTFILISCGESHLLVSWCAGGRCSMAGSDEDHGRIRRSGAEDRGWSDTGQVHGGWTIGRSSDAVCGLHRV